jgi:hypothetical protein
MEKQPVMQAELKALQSFIKILSLTNDAPDQDEWTESRRCYSRSPLWDQYADQYRGVCLLFDKATLSTAVDRHGPVTFRSQGKLRYGSPDHLHPLLRPIVFRWPVSVWPSGGRDTIVSEFLDQPVPDAIYGDGFATPPTVAAAEWLLFRKVTDWASEDEYRYVLVDGSESYLDLDYGSALRCLILGPSISESRMRQAAALARAKRLPVRRAAWKDFGFRLETLG